MIAWLFALAALIVLAPLVAWLARRYGRRMKGGLMMGAVLLGFGHVIDPPSRHLIEAIEEEKGPAERDEPNTTDEAD